MHTPTGKYAAPRKEYVVENISVFNLNLANFSQIMSKLKLKPTL
jgi:hypothetical protein